MLSRASAKPRGLWLARVTPFPLDSGDRVYSAFFARALAQAGAELTFAGLMSSSSAPSDWPMTWAPIVGKPKGKLQSLFSKWPLVAATHCTTEFVAAARKLLQREWDFVVLDNYAMCWALPMAKSAPGGPVVGYVAHNHESTLSRDIARNASGGLAQHWVLWQNYLKVARSERRLVEQVVFITTITEHDGALFAAVASSKAKVLVSTPGFSGQRLSPRSITDQTPRRVLMVGSFHWLPKQENIRKFAECAHAFFTGCGIELDVVGSMPEALARELRERHPWMTLHGFLADLRPCFSNARIALVPEAIGGGFKLKYLDYVFGGVPVASLEGAMEGLPRDVRQAMLQAADLASLVRVVVQNIDDLELLNRLQQSASRAAQAHFDWESRGENSLNLISDVRSRRNSNAVRDSEMQR